MKTRRAGALLLPLSACLSACVVLVPDRIQRTVAPDAPTFACEESDPAPNEILGVALSGGGSRAAVYAAAGLEALWEHGLIDRITHVSSVSGGSIAASYFVAMRPACKAEASQDGREACWRAFFAEFKRAMRYDYAWATELRQALFPNRWLSHTRRATSFMEVLDREFLAGRTFAELYRSAPGGSRPPVLLLNAASFDEARRFVFSNLCIGSHEGDLRSATFARPGCARGVPLDFPVSLAVTSSAAFPGLFGPVVLSVPPSCEVTEEEWWHLGDGGMIDNSGVDTLEEVVLEAVETGSGISTAAILALDASRVVRNSEIKRAANYGLLSNDPSRIVVVTKARGEAFHEFAWDRRKRDLAERGVRADQVLLRYMAAELASWPDSCRSERRSGEPATPEAIQNRMEEIPTLLSIDDCGADLMERAAHQVVHAQLDGEWGDRLRQLNVPVQAASH
jgi:predicted acylesterase/phospholipase RssA